MLDTLTLNTEWLLLAFNMVLTVANKVNCLPSLRIYAPLMRGS